MGKVKLILFGILLGAGALSCAYAADTSSDVDAARSGRVSVQNDRKQVTSDRGQITTDQNSKDTSVTTSRQLSNKPYAKNSDTQTSRSVQSRNNLTTRTVKQTSVNTSVKSRFAVPPSVRARDLSYANAAEPNRTAKTRGAQRSAVPAPQTHRARAGESGPTMAPPDSGSGGTAAASDTNTAPTKNYKTCRDTYMLCMDEFCANKDSQLKRCACSSRLHDFDSIKKNMTKVEDAMQDFNETLLSVNMEKEDAAAMTKATEGEKAYQASTDETPSQKILDQISAKLKSSMADTNSSRALGAINLSMDTDSAFDSVDSLLGATTSTKEGTELYSAALPVCREIAAEVCDKDSVSIVESAYQMAIEQDCNTVANVYSTMQNQELDKVREGSALLDMSRLDIYQKRNSDDILTCKKKMLDKLADNAVCGSDLTKCLDYSGKYIDPSTGEAILTSDLSQLANLIKRPSGSTSWSAMTGNEQFVTFLNAKKKYLEPAMENCQDISDRVWDGFIEDALAQIKLAQGNKLEKMRQSCTTLTTTCLTGSATSLANFDSRALSVFGVNSDKTANEMCSEIQSACSALMNSQDWVGGMTTISDDKTYDQILITCMQIGKNCVIKNCTGISGNFGLCLNQTDVQRQNILNRTLCWDQVYQCIADAGVDKISRIYTSHNTDFTFANIYGGGTWSSLSPISGSSYYMSTSNSTDINYRFLTTKCEGSGTATDQICQMAEKIWGNCERDINFNIRDCPNKLVGTTTYKGCIIDSTGYCGLSQADGTCVTYSTISSTLTDSATFARNEIIIPKSSSANETVLSWFATNTATDGEFDSCYASECQAGTVPVYNNGGIAIVRPLCVDPDSLTSDGVNIPPGSESKKFIVDNNNTPSDTTDDWTNYCASGATDFMGNCCDFGTDAVTTLKNLLTGAICVPSSTTTELLSIRNSDGSVLFLVGGSISSLGLTDPNTTRTINTSVKMAFANVTTGMYEFKGDASGTNYNTNSSHYYNGSSANQCFYGTTDWAGSTCGKVATPPVNGRNNLFIKVSELGSL